VPFRFLIVILALATAALCAAPAGAAPKQGKEYQMFVESPEWAGFTDGTYTIMLVNATGTQQLGSADITVPAALTIVDRNGLAGSGNVLQLRNLGLAPGASVTLTVGLRMPCVAGSYTWDVVAKQSNDFSGLPGNALGPVSGTLATTVNGTCKLRFVGQPASAEKNAQIRAEEFVPASDRLVTVEALDGSPTPQRLTWFHGTIDLRLAQTGPGHLFPSPASSGAMAGLASFSSLAIDASGNYNLRAATTAAGFSAGDSSSFQVIDVVESCNAAKCSAQLTGARTTTTVTGAPGTSTGLVLLSLNLGPAPDCAGYEPPVSDYYEFRLTAERDVTVEERFDKQAVKQVGGKSFLQSCFAAPIGFVAKSEPAAAFDYDGDPANGAEGFVGLLPDCSGAGGPCVADRISIGGGAVILQVSVPAGFADPRFR
jgi:hypothetical protein